MIGQATNLVEGSFNFEAVMCCNYMAECGAKKKCCKKYKKKGKHCKNCPKL